MLKTLLKMIGLFIYNTLEWIVRILYLMLPFGLHILFLQLREKVNPITTISTFLSPDSRWTMVYDGVALVNSNPGAVRKKYENFKKWLKKMVPLFVTIAVLISILLLTWIAYVMYLNTIK